MFRRRTLEEEVQGLATQAAACSGAVEAIQEGAHAAADVMPIKRRTDDNGIGGFDLCHDFIKLIAGKALAIDVDAIIRQVQCFIVTAPQQGRCKACRVAFLLGLPLINKMLMVITP